ncbi:filamentous haemagglutinin family protein [Bradyrhizobium sp. dw_411]|uniref:filamentous haemagglutinin family protein n=1 Tax=Bradyrhizobium sp. dw_411 TaxID=2720082 RepID=UPI001BD0A468|nr:filamentous haemagglutinin family protein [Bradyrhizobium sp. dw_411]
MSKNSLSQGGGAPFTRPAMLSRRALLAGTSALALVLMAPGIASARPVGSGGAVVAAPQIASDAAMAAQQAAIAAAKRSQYSLSRTTQAIQAMRAAQDVAHALARSAPPSTFQGMGPNGLVPVANPNSTTDGLTDWIGASQPVQTPGTSDVTIHQTQSSAILSWNSFNVGSNTTLTFDQQGNASWVALNRVVGNASPSQILGTIKADGTVLIINQNGIIFGGGAQINTNSLIASTLEVGRAIDTTTNTIRTLAQRNQEFLAYGLIGFGDVNGGVGGEFSPSTSPTINSPTGLVTQTGSTFTYQSSGSILVQNGAQIAGGEGGYILLAAPVIENAGHLSAMDGQVVLAAGDQLTLVRATGASDSIAPGIRGFLAVPGNLVASSLKSVVNDVTGLIESPRGSIFLGSTDGGATVNAGGLFATTSVSRNGAIEVSGTTIEIAPNSIIAITPDNNGETIPQDSTSVADFKPSQITIANLSTRLFPQADSSALVDIGANAFVYAPSGNIVIGSSPGATAITGTAATSRVFVDSGAVIDASGLKDILIPASRNQIAISPVTANDLADDPSLKDSFLAGITITVDPRLSGVRADGVAWIGSPLISAASYYQQVGVSAAELMTKGGNVTLGVSSYSGTGAATNAPNVIVKAGATIDISGGWVTYQAGTVRTTQLVDMYGHVVDIGHADPNDTYIGIYNGFTVNHARWNVVDTYSDLLRTGSYYQPQYNEGRDAGSLTVKGSAAALDSSTVFAQAFPGERQLLNGEIGTGTSAVYGDERAVQAAPSQLPVGGFLFIQAQAQTLGGNANNPYTGGGDIIVESAADYQPKTTNLTYGQTVQTTPGVGDNVGTVIVPTRDPASQLSAGQLGTIALSDGLLSNSGFSQVSLHTSGAVTVAANADVELAPGGVFDVLAGRRITIDGTVSAPSGNITLVTFDSRLISAGGSVFSTAQAAVGDFDININGMLSTRGRWVNDFGLNDGSIDGGAWLDGGSITLYAAPRVSTVTSVLSGNTPATSTDLSGSIFINSGSLLDVSGGGRIDQKGKFNLTAHGGNLSLYDETSYFEIADWGGSNGNPGSLDGFRVNGLQHGTDVGTPSNYVPVNPDQMNARVSIDPNAIRAQGFGGGGTFTLTTPEFAFSDDASSNASAKATTLPLSFFSSAGFANYKITSYKTDIIANPFNNGLGGTDAVLATQTLTIGNGQNLNLTQTMLPSVLNVDQTSALLNLASGGDLFSLLSASVPVNAWDRRGVNLTLGGLLELHVAQGGKITGDAGSSLTISGLLNEGTIRLPGGSIVQQTILPTLYTEAGVLGIHALSDIFSTNPDGSIDESAASRYDSSLTNAQLAGVGSPNATPHPIYLLGMLDAGEGIELAPGSLTDLSGVSIRNPYAAGAGSIATGRIIAGGTLATLSNAALTGQKIFQPALGSVYQLLASSSRSSNGVTQSDLDVVQSGRSMVLDPGSTLNLSGASDTYDQLTTGSAGSLTNQHYVSTNVWSDAGTLSAGAGVTLTGANILAHGGATQANGGTLIALDPVLAQHDPGMPTANLISADLITAAGFDTLVALGSVSNTGGDVTITLGRGLFLESRPVVNNGVALNPDTLVPTLSSTGGTLTINAPYVAFDSNFDTISAPAHGATNVNGSVVFNASAIDFTGAILIDQSVASATFNASGDIRFTGVVPWKQTYFPNTAPVATLNGMIAANGDLTFNAAQLYPTTGSTFSITTTGASSPVASNGGTIKFGRSGGATPNAPYSAGGNLTVQAANIVQGGVIRVPLGTLTLGGSAVDGAFAPATQSVTLADGGITSVSANGLVIPYGTTTDQTEWFFAPTNSDPLTAPPQKLLSLNGANVTIASNVTVDLTGGGDVYAYEFVPGTGGSRDVLDRMNPDQFTSNNGFQYPDGRQVYAIVPGLSNKSVAAFDPIYSSDYGNLSSVSGVGSRVWLNGGNGLAAGWYTLLPAKYAMLPGGMRVAEQIGAKNVVAGLSGTLTDGSIITTGTYGNATGGTSQSQVRLFEVQSQAVINKESQIALTAGNSYFAALAAHNGTAVPQLPIDAARLVINPGVGLIVNAILSTAAAPGGRGAQVDIAGTNIDILASLTGAPADGAVHLTAASLTNLNADSLFVGGTRTDNTDGTTTLNVTAQNLLVENDSATPLSAGEVLLAATSSLTIADGSVIAATGTLSDKRTGAYQIGSSTAGSGTGALLRVANGPERLVNRTNSTTAATLNVGAATLSGTAVMFDSSGADALSSGLIINNAKFVAVGAPRIGFGADPSTYNGLVVSDALKNLLSQSGAQLTLRSQSSIDFAGGNYDFGNIRFDAATLTDLDGGTVAIHGDTVSFGNSGAAGTAAVGVGALSVAANTIAFTGGAVAASFDDGVTLSAANGIFSQGVGSVLDVGAAALMIHTPYIGDRAVTLVAGTNATIPDLTLSSTGAVNIDNAGAGTLAALTGIPGSAITINGLSVAVSGTTINATAGKVQINSTASITLADGATIEAPGYTKVFGDSVDPTTQNAPGGSVTLVAQNGNIALGNATLSVGGGAGDAGTLTLSAPQGGVDFGSATLDGTGAAGGRGGSFAIDTLGAVDLVTLNNRVGAQGFTGGFSVHTSTGDLSLAAGQILTSGSVNLTADGGSVIIAGTIDTSGINGGDVALYGRGADDQSGVTLTDSARIYAYANGYAADDARQAKGGNVTLGTDFISSTTNPQTNSDGSITGTSGKITVAANAIIDVSAKRPGDRLVPLVLNGVKYYNYVQGDQGGTVTLRAPVISTGGSTPADTVNVSVANASSIVGAQEIDLVGFKRWDLAGVANSNLYTGVTLNGTAVTLDVTAGLDTANADGTQATVAGINFLGDKGPSDGSAPTLVDFIQNFNVTADNSNLGGLAAQTNFHAKPGTDLANDGSITLASNWNLAAGFVNVTAATAANLMGSETFTGASGSVTMPYILPGKDADVFANYTTMLYRTDHGSVSGEAPVISLQAGGDLAINASINDGFFQFRDQTSPDYLAASIGSSTKTLIFQVGANPLLGPTFNASASVSGTSTSGGTLPATLYVPYIAGGNSAAPPMVGDPFGSADLMPLLPGNAVASSSSFNFVAGADLSRSSTNVLQGGVGPLLVNPASNGNLSVAGDYTYSYGGSLVNVRYENTFNTTTAGVVTIANSSTSSTWESDVIAKALSVTSAMAKNVFYGPNANQAILIGNDATAKKISREGSLIYVDLLLSSGQTIGGVPLTNDLTSVTLRDIAKISDPSDPKYDAYLHTLYMSSATSPTASNDFFTVASTSASILPDSSTAATQLHIIASVKTTAYIIQKYVDPYFAGASTGQSVATVSSLVRTGTGSIAMSATGNVDLRNGSMPRYVTASGQTTTAADLGGYQLGGTAVYTAGHPAVTAPVTISDPDTGASIMVDPTAFLQTGTNFSSRPTYGYGNFITGNTTLASGAVGVLVADPVYAEGGGAITVTTGGDVLGRRDASLGNAISFLGSNFTWIGSPDEPWRSGSVGNTTSGLLDAQLFKGGIGALGGGDVAIRAGRNLSDLTVVASNSMVTANVTDGNTTGQALMTFGRGDVTITAGSDLLGGSVDIASGVGFITAGGDFASAGLIKAFNASNRQFSSDNLLRLQIADATVTLDAGGTATIEGISAFGPIQRVPSTPGSPQALSNLNASGFYSENAALSVVANGSVLVANKDDSLLTPFASAAGTGGSQQAVYPGTFGVTSITGNLSVNTGGTNEGLSVLLMPSPKGQLQLLAGGDIAPSTIAMLDADPGLLPGLFSSFQSSDTRVTFGVALAFPSVLPSTPDETRTQQHKRIATHANDPVPVRINAGNDIGTSTSGLTLSVPKQARIGAGRDIINMMFFGQNLSANDITRVVAGRDITATTQISVPVIGVKSGGQVLGAPEPALQGNTFVIGGSGTFMIEAGRDLGPFLNSATVNSFKGDSSPSVTETYGGGILSVGNEWNSSLPAKSADVDVMFGVAKGINYDGFRDRYLDPANIAALPSYLVMKISGGGTESIYAPQLIQWMQQPAKSLLTAAYGTSDVDYAQAYASFKALPELQQRAFLNQVYFNELKQTAVKDGVSYLQYSRGYQAVNALFPASLGYTANDLSGGSNGANQTVVTGNLDLRLATIQTEWGGDIDIFGPGGRVIAGSTVRTDAQAARRTYSGRRLLSGYLSEISSIPPAAISVIPPGYEGVLTLRGGNINTFTDGDFLLNQSRLFTEGGGDIVMWSSNADLNAGQGPKTSANFPPVLVKVDQNLFVQTDKSGATTGAGIAALQAAPDSPPSDVFLIAPRGTIDAGAAGIRSSHDVNLAALQILNAANIQAQGNTNGVPTVQAPNIAGLTSASNATAATQQTGLPGPSSGSGQSTVIIVEIVGYGGSQGTEGNDDDDQRKRGQQ